MAETSRYALPLLQSGQAQKEITHNEAIARIDALLHLTVESRTATLPPAGPDGAAWIVAVGAEDAWAGHDGQIAVLDDAGWSFVVPRDGCTAFVRSERCLVCSVDGIWRDDWPVRSLSIAGRSLLAGAIAPVDLPTGGVTVDTEARATLVQLTTALRGLGLLAN